MQALPCPHMFSYRHAFHAGNHADVLKHLALIATLRHLLRKDGALLAVDTHAGAGLYRLDSDFTHTAGEAAEGIERLFVHERGAASAPAKGHSEENHPDPSAKRSDGTIDFEADALGDYLDLVASFNPPGVLRVYPGSPFVMQRLLRPDHRDRLKLFELHPTDSKTLAANVAQLKAGRMIAVARQDGFEGLKALLPPPPAAGGSRRALVLIDPSYEIKSDYARVTAALADSLKRFATGTYLIWYPIIPRPEAHELPRRLRTLSQQARRPWLHATLSIGAAVDPAAGAALSPGEPRRHGLRASGLWVVNPPHTLKPALQAALPRVLAALGRGTGKGYTVESGG